MRTAATVTEKQGYATASQVTTAELASASFAPTAAPTMGGITWLVLPSLS